MKDQAPKYLTEQEIEALFKAIDKEKDVFMRARNRAIFRVAYHRGLRASELGMIELKDYRAEAGRLMVTRLKRSISAEFHLTAAEQTALRAWLKLRGAAAGPLFSSRNHRGISRTALHRLMKRYAAAAGIAWAHMHSLKHSCGTHVAARLHDPLAVQDHLGHKDIRSTMIYTRFVQRDEAAEKLRDWK